MRLDEWRRRWKRSGERDLRHLLRKHWDVVRDEPAQATDDFILSLARRLREGATAVEVREVLSDYRREVQGEPVRSEVDYARQAGRRKDRCLIRGGDEVEPEVGLEPTHSRLQGVRSTS